MVYKEVEYTIKNYMYTATLDNGVIITAYEDGTACGNDGKKYRLTSHVDQCDFYDVLDETVPEGWVLEE